MAFRDPWFQYRRIVLPAHQAIINIETDGDPADVECSVRIGRVVVALVSEDETRLGLGIGGRRRAERGACSQGGGAGVGHQFAPREIENFVVAVAHEFCLPGVQSEGSIRVVDTVQGASAPQNERHYGSFSTAATSPTCLRPIGSGYVARRICAVGL